MVNTSAALAAVAGTILTGAALDRKYSIRSDIAQIRSARKNRKHLERLTEQFGDSDWSYYHVLHHTFGQNDYDEAFLFEDRSWTFGELRAEIGRLALELENMGIHNRTVVAMMIDNSPEFYLLWWALFKIGAIPAPINTSIRQEPFRHCLRISEAELLFCSYELYAAVAASLNLEREPESARGNFSNPDTPKLKSLAIYDYESYSKVVDVAPNVVLLRHQDLDPVRAEMASWAPHPKIGSADTSQYLFTSGTTGLPKAATWPAGYAHMAASPYRWPYMFEKRRRLYACTPMFHGGAT
jgi:acyl-CoA synthetase (AMP-forming)/AMP-acid ligase II